MVGGHGDPLGNATVKFLGVDGGSLNATATHLPARVDASLLLNPGSGLRFAYDGTGPSASAVKP